MSFEIIPRAYPLKQPFTVAHGRIDSVDVLELSIIFQGISARGECRPYARYGETLSTVTKQIQSVMPVVMGYFPDIEQAKARLQDLLPAGAARNAIDCALWHLLCQMQHKTIFELIQAPYRSCLPTLYTISIDTPENMAENALSAVQLGAKILKIKLAGQGDEQRLQALRRACPDVGMMLDMNESWTSDIFQKMLPILQDYHIAFIEQPFPASYKAEIDSPIALFADESCHTLDDLENLPAFYQGINIKLDKTGGLTHALDVFKKAREKNLQIMIGCMMSSSLSIAPAYVLGCLGADYYDLDAPALLAQDVSPAMLYQTGFIYAPQPDLWG